MPRSVSSGRSFSSGRSLWPLLGLLSVAACNGEVEYFGDAGGAGGQAGAGLGGSSAGGSAGTAGAAGADIGNGGRSGGGAGGTEAAGTAGTTAGSTVTGGAAGTTAGDGGTAGTSAGAAGSTVTGGTAGVGGTDAGGAGTGGAAGTGPIGPPPACTASSECPGQDTPCQSRSCINGFCGVSNRPSGTVVSNTVVGDCQQNVCDGQGNSVAVADSSDGNDDGNECTTDVCNGTQSQHLPVAAGTSCGVGGTKVCDGGGKCVECLVRDTCPGQDTDCQVRTCTSGVCGFDKRPDGTELVNQVLGDCKKTVCLDGASVTNNDDSDLPDDQNPCTQDLCSAGVPSHLNEPAAADKCGDAKQLCNGGGFCAGCVQATDCPGVDNDCQTRTCIGNTCGYAYKDAGTPIPKQTAGDCKVVVCDGKGQLATAIDGTDVPPDDSNQCTTATCSALGFPGQTPTAANTLCTQNSGAVCNGNSQCVACLTADQCPGTDSACQIRTCNNGTCGLLNEPDGTLVPGQTAGDCKRNVCNGQGAIVSRNDDNDKPNDSNACTADVCTAGVPSNPPLPADTSCGTNQACDGTGQCVGCTIANDCPGVDNECQTRACNNKVCSYVFRASGETAVTQTSGDCQRAVCDGKGNVINSIDNTDTPADDGNQCTSQACANGVPSFPLAAPGAPCSQDSGKVCSLAGTCVACIADSECANGQSCVSNQCLLPPTVVSTSPADLATAVALPSDIVITFSTPMKSASLASQTAVGACTGTIQVSADNFVTCAGFASSAPTLSADGTVATLVPAPGLLVNSTYQIRVTTGAQSTANLALPANFQTPVGFATSAPNLACNESLVISQYFTAGGSAGAAFKNDYVEIHNRGTTTVNLAGKSLQYAAANGSSWTTVALTGTVAPGQFFLVQLASSGSAGGDPPAVDQTSSAINLATAGGKIALVGLTTALSGACPTGSSVLDFVGYGAGTTCSELVVGPAPGASDAAFRGLTGCQDLGNNSLDFSTSSATPRSTKVNAFVCNCSAANESSTAAELDLCSLRLPITLNVGAGKASAPVSGRVYEALVTEAAGANPRVLAQIGYGLTASNPQYQSGWSWSPMAFELQDGTADQYQGSFIAPSTPGTYRYTTRFSIDGVQWTYCDLNGAGSDSTLAFTLDQLGVLTVTP